MRRLATRTLPAVVILGILAAVIVPRFLSRPDEAKVTKTKVDIKSIEEALGMSSANPEVHKDFIASKHPEGVQADEMAAVTTIEEEMHKAMTVFPRDDDGCPIFWDYQIKGMFKDACRSLMNVDDTASSIFYAWTLAKPIDGKTLSGLPSCGRTLPSRLGALRAPPS